MYQQLTLNRLYTACRRYPLPGGVPTTKASDRTTHKRLISNNLHQKSQEQSVIDSCKLLYILIASQGKSTKSAQDCCLRIAPGRRYARPLDNNLRTQIRFHRRFLQTTLHLDKRTREIDKVCTRLLSVITASEMLC